MNVHDLIRREGGGPVVPGLGGRHRTVAPPTQAELDALCAIATTESPLLAAYRAGCRDGAR